MAKYRCPQCGANHKDQPHKCRLCGYVMDGSVAIPMTTTQTMARQATDKRKGIGSIMLVALLVVLAIAAAAILLGFTGGDLSAGKLRDKVPFLRTEDDGWVKVEDQEGGFTVDLPSSRQLGTQTFLLAENGRLTGWTATIGPETDLSVMYGTVTAEQGETARGELNRLTDADIARVSAESTAAGHSLVINKRTDTDFRGYPAIVYEAAGVDVNGQYGYRKALLFVKGGELYVLSTDTVYKDYPQWGRLTSSFQFTA